MPIGQETPPPRRKSCEACKLAKRRCDTAFPTCSRCLHKGLPCFYPGRLLETCADVIANIPTSTNNDQTIDLFPQNDYLRPIDAAPLYLSNRDTPLRDLTILPPQDRVDIFEGIPISQNVDLAMTRVTPPRQLSEVLANRLQFAVDVLQNIPKMVVTENQTPWAHRQLYKSGMPREMQGPTILFDPRSSDLVLTSSRRIHLLFPLHDQERRELTRSHVNI